MSVAKCERKSARGFTMVELMVVIAIIGVLIGILVPGLAAAYRAAMNMQCQSSKKRSAQMR